MISLPWSLGVDNIAFIPGVSFELRKQTLDKTCFEVFYHGLRLKREPSVRQGLQLVQVSLSRRPHSAR